MMTYALGVDLGTTYSAAAVGRDGRVEVCTLGSTAPAIPSVVVLRADGDVLVGEVADRRSIAEPTRTAREFKRRLGDPTPIVLGGTPYGAEALMAHLLRSIVAQVSEREGERPDHIVLTHPANYGPYKLGLLEEAARLAGLELDSVRYLSEPQAAAIAYAQAQRVEPGELVAVYDFGGGTFDAAVVRRTDTGFELVGVPEGMERLGGIDVDTAVLAHVNTSVDGMLSELDPADGSTRSALSRLRDECRLAKEALSTDTDTSIPVSVPGLQTEVRLTREELEGMIRPRIAETIEALQRAVASAHISMDEVSRILLVGGTSRMPIVAQMVRESTGRPVAVDAHPKLAIASGAALLAGFEDTAAAAAAPAAAPAAGAAPSDASTAPATATVAVDGGGAPVPTKDASGPPPRAAPLPSAVASARRRRRILPLVIGGAAGVAVGVAALVILTGGDDGGSSATTTARVATSTAGTTPASTASGSSTPPPTTTAAGNLVAFAGNGQSGTAGEGGPATNAALSQPENVAAASTGDVYIADNVTQRILKVSGGVLTRVFAGNPAAGQTDTFGVAVAPDDSVWFSNAAGVSKLEGGGATPVLTAQFLRGGVYGLGFDRTGNLYVVESGGNRLLRLDLAGNLKVLAGTGVAGPTEGGAGDGGPATAAALGQPFAVAVDDQGVIYVAERLTHRVRRIASDGKITTVAGGGATDVTAAPDGAAATSVRFGAVAGLAVDAGGRVYVSGDHLIVRFGRDGQLQRVASGLGAPKGLGFDRQGTLYFVDGQRVGTLKPS